MAGMGRGRDDFPESSGFSELETDDETAELLRGHNRDDLDIESRSPRGAGGGEHHGGRGVAQGRTQKLRQLDRSPRESFASWQDLIDTHFSQGSIRGSVINLASATLGAGALSIPYAMQSPVTVGLMRAIVAVPFLIVAGLGIGLGILMMAGCAAVTMFSILLLVHTRDRTGLGSYEEVTFALFGRGAGLFVECNIIAFCCGSGIAYAKTLRDFLSPMIELAAKSLSDPYLEHKAMFAIWFLVILPLSLSKSMNELRFTSVFGVASIAYLAVSVLIHATREIASGSTSPPWRDLTLWANPDPVTIILCLPILMFAFTCQVNVFSIFDELQRASTPRMTKVAGRSIMCCLTLYVTVGAAGFLEFGDGTCGNILNNYKDEFLAGNFLPISMYVAIGTSIMTSLPLIVYPVRLTIENMTLRAYPPAAWRHYFWTVVLSGGFMTVSMLVPHINTVFQLIGGTSSAFICWVLPALFAIRLDIHQGNPLPRAGIYLLAVGGVITGVLSTSVTIWNIYYPSEDLKGC